MRKASTRAIMLRKKYNRLVVTFWLLLLTFAVIAPFFAKPYFIVYVTVFFLYTLLSISLNIAAGYCGMQTFATGALYGMGAYVSAFAYVKYGFSFFPAVLLGTLFSVISGFIISGSAFKVTGTYLALVSYGMLQIFNRIILSEYEYTGGSSGFRIGAWMLFGNRLGPKEKYYFILIILVLVFLLQRNLSRSQWCRDFLAVKNDPIGASSLGISVGRTRIICFVISSAIAGLAGALYAFYASFISPESFTFKISIMILLMIVIGGRGTLTGPILGTLFIYTVPDLLNDYPDVKQLAYGIILIASVLLLPQGLCGVLKRKFKEVAYNKEIEDKPISANQDFEEYRIMPEEAEENILVLKGLTKQYGGLVALNSLDMVIKRGTIHSLIGPNGSGKTTCVNTITGIEKPTGGTVLYNGKNINGISISKLAYLGITRTFQHVRLFQEMSVIDNVVTGARLFHNYSLAHALLSTKKRKKIDREHYWQAQDCLEYLGLGSYSNAFPETLSSGQQKLLEIARAIVTKPKLLILDEPCAGLTETETAEFATLMKEIRKTGITTLLIEHHMRLVMEVSDYITVIDNGIKIGEGTPEIVSTDPIVRKAYLGE